MEQIKCECGRIYIYDYAKGHTKTRCNSCWQDKRRSLVKDKALAILGGKCCICEYKKCKRALVFHHRNPEEKSFEISSNTMRKWSSVESELKKCVLLCANCHMEVHEGVAHIP